MIKAGELVDIKKISPSFICETVISYTYAMLQVYQRKYKNDIIAIKYIFLGLSKKQIF